MDLNSDGPLKKLMLPLPFAQKWRRAEGSDHNLCTENHGAYYNSIKMKNLSELFKYSYSNLSRLVTGIFLFPR